MTGAENVGYVRNPSLQTQTIAHPCRVASSYKQLICHSFFPADPIS